MDALTRERHDPPRPRQRGYRGPSLTVGPGGLTEQEVAILRLIAQGLTYDQIGQVRQLAEQTVKYYAKRIYRRLGARCAAHAVHIGWQRGLLGGRPQPSTGHAHPVGSTDPQGTVGRIEGVATPSGSA